MRPWNDGLHGYENIYPVATAASGAPPHIIRQIAFNLSRNDPNSTFRIKGLQISVEPSQGRETIKPDATSHPQDTAPDHTRPRAVDCGLRSVK